MRDHSALGWAYAEAVVARDVPAGNWATLACQRSLDDRDAAAGKKFGYRFDVVRANRVCKFIEQLTHVKGALGGHKIILEPWQCWTITQVFGWLHSSGPRRDLRRFRSVHLEIGRGNGKSCLSSAVALYMLSADGDFGAEVYCSATGTKQARITFDDARAMASAPASKSLIDAAGIRVAKHAIYVPTKNSKMEATSAQYERQDGYNISFSLCDEMHAMKDRGLYDVLVTGAGKRPNSIIWAITTAGSDRSGICFERRTYLTKILEGRTRDDTVFGAIWSMDDDDDWTTEIAWRKANPNYLISVDPAHLAKEAKVARVMPAAQNNFKTKHCNFWVSAESPWMNMLAWDAQADPSLDIAAFAGRDCFIGVDLASVSDMCSVVYAFPEHRADGKTHYTMFAKHYLSQQAVSDGRNSQYQGWAQSGQLIATAGDATDYDQIEEDLIADTLTYVVREIAFDPHQARMMMQHLQDHASVIEVRQIVLNISPAMKFMDTLVRSGRLHHDGQECYAWQISNIVAEPDRKDNIYPRKERPESKIDAGIASFMALARAMLYEEQDLGISIAFV